MEGGAAVLTGKYVLQKLNPFEDGGSTDAWVLGGHEM